MKRFGLKLALFCLPIVVLLSFPLFVFVKGKEYVTIDAMIDRAVERDGRFLFGLAYSNPAERYKLRMTLAVKPDILVLGTSRALQLRGAFFKPDVRFYNAGLGVRRLSHFRTFLSEIPVGQEPKILIATLDQWFFNGNWDDFKTHASSLYHRDTKPMQVFFSKWVSIYRDYYAGKFQLAQLDGGDGVDGDGVERIGIQSIVKHEGFRRDGSWDWGDIATLGREIGDGYEQGYKRTMEQMTSGVDRFRHGQEVSPAALNELALLLQTAKKRGIRVIGYLPPFPSRVHEALASMGDRHSYIKKLPEALGPIFAEYGHEIMDVSDLAVLGASDKETIDGYHESEKAALRLVIAMARQSDALRRYCDIQQLENALRNAEDDYYVFSNIR